jgi:hypothetical protein
LQVRCKKIYSKNKDANNVTLDVVTYWKKKVLDPSFHPAPQGNNHFLIFKIN